MQMQRAKKLGMNWVVDVALSPISKHKYRVYLIDGSNVDYGNINYENVLIHEDTKRRRQFLARWSHYPTLTTFIPHFIKLLV